APGRARVSRPGIALTGRGSAASVEYTDPSVLEGDVPIPAADVWSLGVLLHRAIAGLGLYGELPAEDGLTALRRVLGHRPALAADLPAPTADAVRDCLAPPAERPSAAVVADRLAAQSVGV